MSNIDELFKKGLDGKGMEYSNASWASMEQMLNTEKVGFFARYKLLLGLSSVLLISSVSLFYLHNEETSANTPALETNYVATKTFEPKPENDIELASSSIQSDKAQETKEEVQVQSVTAETKVNTVSKAQSLTTLGSTARKSGNNSSTTSTDTYKNPTDNGFRTTEPIFSTGVSEQSGGDNGINILTSEKLEDNVNDFHLVEFPSISESEILTKPNFGASILAEGISLSEFEYSESAKFPSKVDFLPDLKKKNFSLFVSPYAGHVMYANNAKLPVNIIDEERNLGNSTTTNWYNYGLNIGVKKGGWMLSSGIGFLSLRQNTFYTQSTKEYVYTIVPRISNANFTTTPRGTRVALITQTIVDSSLITIVEPNCSRCEVAFNYVAVPLNVQYNFGKSRLRYFAEAGMTASFLQNATGVYATLKHPYSNVAALPSVQLVELSTSEDVSKILLQANTAVGAKFWVAPRWNIWSSYGYGMSLNSMLGSYDQKPTIQNVRVGVEFKLR